MIIMALLAIPSQAQDTPFYPRDTKNNTDLGGINQNYSDLSIRGKDKATNSVTPQFCPSGQTLTGAYYNRSGATVGGTCTSVPPDIRNSSNTFTGSETFTSTGAFQSTWTFNGNAVFNSSASLVGTPLMLTGVVASIIVSTTSSSAPSVASCGSSSIVGTDFLGEVTTGSPCTAGVLTFKTARINKPFCICSNNTENGVDCQASSTPTTVTLNMPSGPAAGDKVVYVCFGVNP